MFLGCALILALAPGTISRCRDLPKENLLHWILLNENTLYSPSFSEKKFSRIAPGMKKVDVTKELGPPLRIIEDSGGRTKRMVDYVDGRWVTSFPDLPPDAPVVATKFFYYYTQQGDPKADWYIRAVEFDVNGVVRKVARDVYVD